MSGTLTVEGFPVPFAIEDLAGFRDWADSLDEDGPRVHFYRGDVWIAMSPQDYESHLVLVSEIDARLRGIAKILGAGEFYADGGWITNEPAGLSTAPDGFLVLWETIRTGEARLRPRKRGRGSVELAGRADMVLEVVSDSSERKDLVDLVEGYARAAIPEYWIVDARGEAVSFRILRLEGGVYRETPVRPDGFIDSAIWGRAFRLERSKNPAGWTTFDLIEAPL